MFVPWGLVAVEMSAQPQSWRGSSTPQGKLGWWSWVQFPSEDSAGMSSTHRVLCCVSAVDSVLILFVNFIIWRDVPWIIFAMLMDWIIIVCCWFWLSCRSKHKIDWYWKWYLNYLCSYLNKIGRTAQWIPSRGQFFNNNRFYLIKTNSVLLYFNG